MLVLIRLKPFIEATVIDIGLNYGMSVENWVCESVVAQTSTDKHMGKNPVECPYLKQIYVFEKFMNLSRINAVSNKMTTGIATKNNDTGSGGDKNAPKTNAANHMCLR